MTSFQWLSLGGRHVAAARGRRISADLDPQASPGDPGHLDIGPGLRRIALVELGGPLLSIDEHASVPATEAVPSARNRHSSTKRLTSRSTLAASLSATTIGRPRAGNAFRSAKTLMSHRKVPAWRNGIRTFS